MFAGFLRFAVTTAAIPFLCQYLNGMHLLQMENALIVGLILAGIYSLLRPVMRMILSVLNFFTLGLIYVVADAWLVWTVPRLVENSIAFDSFLWAGIASLIINAARTVIGILFDGKSRRR